MIAVEALGWQGDGDDRRGASSTEVTPRTGTGNAASRDGSAARTVDLFVRGP